MKTIEYTTVDKSTWGAGPWMSEPDKVQWQDEATGLPCLIHRGPSGSLCGYVGLSEGHPFFEKGYDDVDVDVHGGLTFAGLCRPSEHESSGICHLPEPGEPAHVWWLGFDCAHCDDLSPGRVARYRATGSALFFDSSDVYRDIAYVRDQVASLARQLKETA